MTELTASCSHHLAMNDDSKTFDARVIALAAFVAEQVEAERQRIRQQFLDWFYNSTSEMIENAIDRILPE
jgi:hypothetical protein